MRVLHAEQRAEWMQTLEHCAPYDFYHLPQYHMLAAEDGEGAPHLFLRTEGDYTIALPLLVRSLDGAPQSVGTGWRDATSVYGYAGPVCSHRELPAAVIRNFQSALRERLSELRVVAVFSRLHPLFTQGALLSGLGECQMAARTVSIDLRLPPVVQRSKFRKDHKYGINKLRRLGVTCVHDQDGSYLEDFVRIYHETMRRVDAAPTYYFSAAYFQRLRKSLDSRIHLFVCLLEGRVICGGLFVVCHDILQYHLSGTLNEALKIASMKLLLDEVRLWGTSQGLRVFHLGGGATPLADDSLLLFKKGFSDRVHEFSVWRWVLFPDVYQRLCEDKSQWNERQGIRAAIPHYFPAYRCPTVPSVPIASSIAAPEPSAEPEELLSRGNS